jgi:hypothetical protein
MREGMRASDAAGGMFSSENSPSYAGRKMKSQMNADERRLIRPITPPAVLASRPAASAVIQGHAAHVGRVTLDFRRGSQVSLDGTC